MARGEGRTGLTGSQPSDASFDVMGQADNALERRIAELEREVADDGPGTGVLVITPSSPFIINQVAVADGIEVTGSMELPIGTTSIVWIVAVYRKTAQGVGKNKEQRWTDIPQASIDVLHFEGVFEKSLSPNTEYGLVALIAKGDFAAATKTRNPDPPDDPNFLTTWNTIGFFTNDPSKPDTGLILENKTDDVTKAFDAFIAVRIYAPINGLVTAYTGDVTINGTTTVTGTDDFTTQSPPVAIGDIVLIQGKARQVVTVNPLSLIVDRPYLGSGSGLELLFGVPHTWESALVRRVIPRFKLKDEADDRSFGKPYDIDDTEKTQNLVDFRVASGFVAAREYNWRKNILVGSLEGQREITPDTPQIFTAGGFASASPGIPELTSVSYVYEDTDPYNARQRHVSVLATQPNPPIGLDSAELRRFDVGTGTVSVATGDPVVVGVGTDFLTRLVAGYQVIVGAQTFTVQSIADDTHFTATANSTATASGQAYLVSKRVIDDKNLRRLKFHPPAGGQIRIQWGDRKTKKLNNSTFRTTFTAQNGETRNVDDNFTTGADDDGAVIPGAMADPIVITNTVDGDPETALARVSLSLPTANGLSFAANNIGQVSILYARRNEANTAFTGDGIPEIWTIDDTSAVAVVKEFDARIGQRYRIFRISAHNGDKITQAIVAVDFVAGGVRTVAPGDALTVPAPVFVSVARSDTDDNKTDDVEISLTQNGTDIILFKEMVIKKSVNGGAYRRVAVVPLKANDVLHSSPTAAFTDTFSFTRRAAKTAQYQATAFAVKGKASATTTSALQGATAADPPVPGALAFPSAPTGANNSVDGDPAKKLARIALTIATASGTFAANNTSQVEILLIRRNATNSADVGAPFSEVKVLATSDLAATSAIHEFFLRQGQKFRIIKVVARNGHQRTETTGTADFTAGGLLHVDIGDAKVVPAPSFFVQPAVHDTDSNKEVDFTLRLTQDGVDIIEYKRMVIERQTAAGAWKLWQEVGINGNDTLHASVTASVDFPYVARRKAGKTVNFRVTAFAVGGKPSATTTSSTLGASPGDFPTDADRPATPAAPTVAGFIDGRIDAEADVPASNFNTITKYRYALQTTTATPNRDAPAVGVDGVVALQKAHLKTSFRRALSDISATTFRVRVQALNAVGWSEWSAQGTVAGTAVGRPLQDFIGDADPKLPIGLQANGTAPASPAIANDTTHFSISTSDPTNYTTLLASFSMFLLIPSLTGADRIRKITSFDDTNNRFLVAVAFGSTPGNSLAYEIHYGLELGEMSASAGNTTTTLGLGTAGAALANGTLIGMQVFMPTQPAADQIRRIISHVSGVITFDVAVATAITNTHCYAVSRGSFGYASIAPLSGIITGVPCRVWGSEDGTENLVEIINPVGGNAFALEAVHIEMLRKSNGVLKKEFLGAPSIRPTYVFESPTAYTPIFRFRIQSMFRDGTADDGWSSKTFYVEGVQGGTIPSSPYSPGAFPPVEVDNRDPDSYPNPFPGFG